MLQYQCNAWEASFRPLIVLKKVEHLQQVEILSKLKIVKHKHSRDWVL